MRINLNGTELYYEVTGSGDPLIMVHGNGEDHTIFNEAAEVLKNHFTVFLLDSRGHGKSQQTDEYHYIDMAEDIFLFIEKLHIENVTYYGFSDGGIIGLLLASKHPGLLKRMIISGANTKPKGIKRWLRFILIMANIIHKNPLYSLMLTEPDINKDQLASISTPTLILAGSKDLVREEDTKFIAENIKGSTLTILPGEGHETYIVHKREIADLILSFCGLS